MPLTDPMTDPNPYVIVRTKAGGAGVFAGTLLTPEGPTVVLVGARRLWHWEGAASLSQMAMSGTSKPKECKFPEEVLRVCLIDVAEILLVTPKARKSIESVPVWKS